MDMDLFKINLFEESAGNDEDFMSLALESGELDGSPITTDENLSKPWSISIPGNSGETPSSKPYDSTGATGIAESPTGKPYDAMALSIPAGKEIPHGSYHQILADLRGSYKTAKAAFEQASNNVAEAALELAAIGGRAIPQETAQPTE